MDNGIVDKNPNDLPEKTLLSPRDVASFFGVSLKTVYRWHKEGLIVGVTMKRSVRIFRESVVQCMKKYVGMLLW